MHFQSDTDAATFLKRRLSHEIEGLTIVEAGAPADLWLSIVTLPERICTHCAPGEKVEWAATFTLPIPKHAKAVPTEVLLLSGRVTPPRRPLPAFIRAAKKIRADHPCRRDMPPNSTQQLSRPGAGPAAELP